MKSKNLLNQLTHQTGNHIIRAEQFLKISEENLNNKQNGNWSVLECCEHLNLYLNDYLPRISNEIIHSKLIKNDHFKPAILGNYFVKSMQSQKKMKTAKDKNPNGKILEKTVILNLIENLQLLNSIIYESENLNLNSIKISTSLSKFIKMNLGDTLRFLVAHNERHFQQAESLI